MLLRQALLPARRAYGILSLEGGENMPKTDKELAIELTIAYIQNWNSAKIATTPMSSDDVVDLVKFLHKAVKSID